MSLRVLQPSVGTALEEQSNPVRLAVHAVPLPVNGFNVNSKDDLNDSHHDFFRRPIAFGVVLKRPRSTTSPSWLRVQ